MTLRPDSADIGQYQQLHRDQEIQASIQALMMTPLMHHTHEDFATVRRHADALRDWFTRETGWVLHIEREGARLYKRPAECGDATRGLPRYDRRRYVLLCLACAVLERAEPQITLRILGERLLQFAAEPVLIDNGFSFTLAAQQERRELVDVCRTLLDLGVLALVTGDEEGFVRAGGQGADALYDVHRRTLAGMLAAVRGPSTFAPGEAPETLDARLHALVDEYAADSDEGRRTKLRHHLSRRLLDDPVVYLNTLDADARAYFVNQRGPMAARLSDATGLTVEQRAEGLALVDTSGDFTDVEMPAEGTDAHATLLTADYLATHQPPRAEIADADVVAFLARAKIEYGRYWRKSAREPGAERELAGIALDRLEKLQLIARADGTIRPRPALARFALGEAEIRAQRPGVLL